LIKKIHGHVTVCIIFNDHFLTVCILVDMLYYSILSACEPT